MNFNWKYKYIQIPYTNIIVFNYFYQRRSEIRTNSANFRPWTGNVCDNSRHFAKLYGEESLKFALLSKLGLQLEDRQIPVACNITNERWADY